MIEVWADIKGYEGAYQVSNKGNVRSVDRRQEDKNGRGVNYKGKLIRPLPNSRGYLRVQLKSNNKAEKRFVHRLVAEHFAENPLPEINIVVNHIDSNPQNNSADNLEWTTYQGNSQHALKAGRMTRTEEWLDKMRKAMEKSSKPVVACYPETEQVVYTFNSIHEAGKCGFEISCVSQCCSGKRKTHKGLAWRYGGDNE